MSESTAPAKADTEAKRLYLIDGYSTIFRAFYAIRNLSNSRGEPTNAVYGFLQMLKKLLADHEPDLIGVALDVSRQTVRTDRFAEYKANRAPMPEDLRPQVPVIRRVLEAFDIPVLELESYEADDVLGTLAKKASDAGYQVVLVSADKDLFQLITPSVSMYHTGRDKLYDPALVEEDFGVPPGQVIDVLALMGDSVDNVPGVPGIGEKGAKKLIQEYGSLEKLLDGAAEVKRKSYREGLIEHREQAELSRELVTIHCDLDVPFEPEKLRREKPDIEALRELYAELEFKSLLDELGSAAGSVEAPKNAVEVEEPTAWAERLAALKGDVYVALAAPGGRAPLALALAGKEGHSFYADFRRPAMHRAALEGLQALAAAADKRLVGHDLKEVLRQVEEGWEAAARLFDLMLASYLLRPSNNHGLEDLALERYGAQLITPKEAGWDRGGEPAAGGEALAAYLGEQVGYARLLASGLEKELDEAGLGGIYRDMEAPLLPVLLGMEEAGVLLDCDHLAAMSREIGGEIDRLEGEIYELAGEEFNINSPQQLGVILFEKLGYPVLKKTRKTKSYATGAEVLEELAHRGYPLPDLLLRFRELTKLRSTYIDALPTMVADDGRVHTRFNQAVAATGRLSSTHPNLQNIPIRTELGQRIRKAFIAPEGQCLLVADYSQVELRVLAHIAGEEALEEAFRRGEDIHRSTAATVFGMAPELVTAEQRRAAKTINFGILYGISGFGLAKSLGGGISPKEADAFIKEYLDRFPAVRRYLDETKASAKETGKVETLYGRVRWLPDIRSRNWNLRANAERMAINARIQGTAADLMKMALIAVEERLDREFPDARLLLTVHDEVVLEVAEVDAEAVAALVKEEMEGVAELSVPLAVDVAWGESWYDAKD